MTIASQKAWSCFAWMNQVLWLDGFERLFYRRSATDLHILPGDHATDVFAAQD